MPIKSASKGSKLTGQGKRDQEVLDQAREGLRAELKTAEIQLQEAMVVLADREKKVEWAWEKLKFRTYMFTKAIADCSELMANHTRSHGELVETIPDDEGQNSQNPKHLELQRRKKEWSYGIWLEEYLRETGKRCVAVEQVVRAERRKYALVRDCWALECEATELNESPSAKPIEF